MLVGTKVFGDSGGTHLDPKRLAKLARLATTTPPLHVVENFIVALTAANDGKPLSLYVYG